MNESCALILVGLAAFFDLYLERVPNPLVFIFLLGGLAWSFSQGLPDNYQLSFLVVAALFFVWYQGFLGAADVKVCFVLSLFLAADLWLWALLFSCLVSLGFLLVSKKKRSIPMMPTFLIGLSLVLLW